MTRATTGMRGLKAAVAAIAVLCAALALGVLATASSMGDRAAPPRTTGAVSLEPSPLGR